MRLVALALLTAAGCHRPAAPATPATERATVYPRAGDVGPGGPTPLIPPQDIPVPPLR